MTYQPSVYREQGGNTLVIASSGKISMESGSTMTIASGAGVTLAATLTVSSGGGITAATGSNVATYVETISTSATQLTAGGISVVTGTTVGPTMQIANPVTGVAKYICLAGTTAVTGKAIITGLTTAISFGTSGSNQITLSTSTLRGISLVGISTAAYRVVGMYHNADAGLGNVTT